METNVPNNAFPITFFFFLEWGNRCLFFFFKSTSCFQVVKAHTREFNGSPRLHGTFFLALKNLEQFWHNTLSSACSSLWATTSATTNDFFWPGWNIFLSFPYFCDKLLSWVLRRRQFSKDTFCWAEPHSDTKWRNAFSWIHYTQWLPLRCVWIDTERSLICVWQKFSVQPFPLFRR